jgi:hypothetical protein
VLPETVQNRGGVSSPLTWSRNPVESGESQGRGEVPAPFSPQVCGGLFVPRTVLPVLWRDFSSGSMGFGLGVRPVVAPVADCGCQRANTPSVMLSRQISDSSM